MRGIWSLPVHLIGTSFSNSYALARIIINITFFALIVFPWARLKWNVKIKEKFNKIIYGAHLLLLWFILNILDLFLHEAKLRTGYGYILYDICPSCTRYASDIFILAGTHQLISEEIANQPRNQLRKKARSWQQTGELIVLVQVILALYFLGSLLAEEVLWLQIADPSIIDRVTSRKEKFEAAFFIIQFLLTLTMAAGAAVSVWYWRQQEEYIPKQAYLSAALAFTLWIRCYAELVIVIRYDYMHHSTLRNTYIARDTAYGLCSFLLLLLAHGLARDASNQDPHIISQAKIEEETRHHLLDIVESAIAAGQQPPQFRGVLQTVRHQPFTALSDGTRRELGHMLPEESARLRIQQEEYLEKLEDDLGNLNAAEFTREF